MGKQGSIEGAKQIEIRLTSLLVKFAGEAQAAGAAGLVYMRVGEHGSIDAAKPVKEGLSEQQSQDIIARTSAQPVLFAPLQYCCQHPLLPDWCPVLIPSHHCESRLPDSEACILEGQR